MLALAGCVQLPQIDDDQVLLTSNYPIIEVNGRATADQSTTGLYRVQLPAGENDVVIVYQTYNYDYHCRFAWDAQAANRYEVTDYGYRYPLTLFRWEYVNSLWAKRSMPTDPVSCDRRPADSIVSPGEDV